VRGGGRRRWRDGAEAGDATALYAAAVAAAAGALLRPVVNATGVLLHTNLGRAPTPPLPASGYSNLEYDLAAGGRGSRHRHAAALAALACAAEDALAVNNNASAVLLGLAALCAGREVLVSRGEAVEIGGGFRIPDILAASGARLVDVGTTNRTRSADYEAALRPSTAAILSVHPSNFEVRGFVERPATAELAAVAHAGGALLLVDLGSGLLDETVPWLADGPPSWLRGEPGARQALAAGADAVFFSGDKLLGGPQAGIAAGRRDLIERLRRHPLARAVRIDKHRLALLQDVLLAYLDGRAADIPFWRMATCDPAPRAERLAASLDGAEAVPGDSLVGAGSAPGSSIPGVVVRWKVPRPDDTAARLRAGDPPVVARVEDGALVIDLRTVEPELDNILLQCLLRTR
jgi:L-seryl-tRNA(Ser) seleniumtransferase